MKVVIKMTGHGFGQVHIDGVQQDCVEAVEFSAVAGGVNKVKLTYRPEVVEVEADDADWHADESDEADEAEL